MIEDEGDSLKMFSALFGRDTKRVEDRAQRERVAGMTAKQRARKAVRTEQMNFRVTPEFKATLAALAEARGMSMSDAIEVAVIEMAKRKGASS